tara:strand:+ start:4105 stop:4386 length:282 start_codon:yes stop_codon:yes gene_type:complete
MKFSTNESDYLAFREIREAHEGGYEAIFEARTVPIGTGEKVQIAALSLSGWFSKIVTIPAADLRERRRVIENEQGGTAAETIKAIAALRLQNG